MFSLVQEEHTCSDITQNYGFPLHLQWPMHDPPDVAGLQVPSFLSSTHKSVWTFMGTPVNIRVYAGPTTELP